MAIGKGRSGARRTSTTSSSYSSNIAPIVFVALCLFGVWMLSSSTLVSPPKTTSRATTTGKEPTATKPSTTTASGLASSIIDSIATMSKGANRPPAFEDHPGDLPDDAIKSSDGDNEEMKPRSEDKDEQSDSASTLVKDLETENDPANRESREIESENDKKPETEETEDKQISGNANEEIEQEKPKEDKAQTTTTSSSLTDDNSIAQSAEAEQTTPNETEEIFQANKNDIQQDGNGNEQQEHHDPEEIKHDSQEIQEARKNMISDEDQQKRIEQQQQQEDAQLKLKGQLQHETQGITSEDQIQHDESNIDDAQKTELPLPSTENPNKEAKHRKKSKKSKEWSTQAVQSVNQKERTKTDGSNNDQENTTTGLNWKLCNVTAGADYIPCLDNEAAIIKLKSRRHFEHRERHCPEEPPMCLVPLPKGYKRPIEWPKSREKIWYHNVPHTLLADVKGHQNWMKVSGEFLTFPGGGTQFIHGALHYIDFIQKAVPEIAWGKRTRVILDVGCGVASLGGFLFERDVLAMSFAPKDEHEAQIQFALERGIPAISAVMGSQRLPFPSGVFDIVHCARCRVPWHAEGGALLLELNRVLRPGGYFVWSATPVYQKIEEDVEIWKEMSALTVSMCWELVTIKKDKLNSIGAAIYHKPDSNDCYNQRKSENPPMCKSGDDPSAAWYVPLQSCLHKIPMEEEERGSKWPKLWPERLQTPPYWLNRSQLGVYGKPAPEDFAADYEHWKHVVSKSYMSGLGINWSTVRNIMDMRAVYGGFAAALKDLKVWVMNVVNVDSPDTLPVIYERGLFGIYHDWCESFSTYPRSYDLLHADHLFSRLKNRCKITAVMAEVDRIVRPGGKLIVQDDSSTIRSIEEILKSLHWEVRMTFYQKQDGMLSAQKTEWRPEA